MKDLYMLSDKGYIGLNEDGNSIYSTVIIGIFSSKAKAINALKNYDNGVAINYLNTFEIKKYYINIDYL
jgi:hypothetical protein